MRNSLPILLVVLLAGCAPSAAAVQAAIAQTQVAATATPQIPAEHRAAIDRLIDDGSLLVSLLENDVTYDAFKTQLVIYRSRHSVVIESGEGFLPQPVLTAMKRALLGWSLAFELWLLKTEGSPEPNEFSWPEFEATTNFLADDAVTGKYLCCANIKLSGKKYLLFNENISVLLGKASAEFVVARSGLIQLQK